MRGWAATPSGTSRNIDAMAKKTTTDNPANLSLVPAQGDSATLSGKEKRLEALARGRLKAAETRRKRKEATDLLRAQGVPSNVHRYHAGEYPVSEWTDEEISKGRPMNLDGSFTGQWPKIPGKDQQAIKRELLKRGQTKMDGMYWEAIDALHDIALNGENESARVKAALALAERVAGKVPDRIELKSSDPWQDILDEIMDDEVLERVQQKQIDVSG